MPTIAIEGCSHAGKTTLIKQICPFVAGIIALPDYVTFAGGDDKVPPAPAKNVTDEIEALHFFLDLDVKRWKSAMSSEPRDHLIIADRSFHTLLAHRLSIQYLTGMDVFHKSCLTAQGHKDLLKPDLIIYLDTPQAILDQRYKTRVSHKPVNGHVKNYNYEEKMKLVFNKHEYNQIFRKYFIPILQFENTPLIVLDGSLSIDNLTAKALQTIRDL